MDKSLPLLLMISCSLQVFAQQKSAVEITRDSVVIHYGAQIVFAGGVSSAGTAPIIRQSHEKIDSCDYITIVVKDGNGGDLRFSGRVDGDQESIACESESQSMPVRVVRHSVGKSHSLTNNAVYERSQDWLLSVDNNMNAHVTVEARDSNRYDIQISGSEIMIRFRPEYFRRHRKLHYFDPSSYAVWKKPIVGWCSWFAFFNKVTEKDVHKTADEISKKLLPYGLQYLQIDDGFQQTPIGLPDTWLTPNEKFPSGLPALAAYIHSRGLIPGIWTNVSFADSAAAFRHAALFVRDSANKPVRNSWVSYVMDGSNTQTIDSLITPVYKGLKDAGFDYFKLDALRHLRYEGYNTFKDYFSAKKASRVEAFRNVVLDVRDRIGRDRFLLACWGARPELVGIADGCRIGDDGFSYAGLTQFNSFNNIIWRNDPDHIVLSKAEAFRSCTATSLTGSLFMLTDKPALYEDSLRLEAARRTIPVLFTQPGQVYDVDPSHSARINETMTELSGGGPRSFDAGASAVTGLFELELNMPFESWIVLGRVDNRDRVIPFKALGLDEKQPYLVFEFWSKVFRGTAIKEFTPGPLDPAFNCQAFCIRKKLNRPQLLATNRHISGGALEIEDLKWTGTTLTGRSKVVRGEKYRIYVHENAGDRFRSVAATHAKVMGSVKTGEVRAITLMPESDEPVTWSVEYK